MAEPYQPSYVEKLALERQDMVGHARAGDSGYPRLTEVIDYLEAKAVEESEPIVQIRRADLVWLCLELAHLTGAGCPDRLIQIAAESDIDLGSDRV